MQALCICPTRELVVQNLNVLERMARFTSISATSTAATDSRFSRYAVLEVSVVGSGHRGAISNKAHIRGKPTEHGAAQYSTLMLRAVTSNFPSNRPACCTPESRCDPD